VVLAASGEEALARLDAGETFDAIVCDLVMPGASGMDVHLALRARHPALVRRVAFITGGAFTAAARAFLEQPGVVVLEKPFEGGALCAVVERLLAAAPAGPG
jgi:CheY-like chemotaxis protein